MPPSVARSQLPNRNAQATKEPLRRRPERAFVVRCCTNNTQPFRNSPAKLLFLLKFQPGSKCPVNYLSAAEELERFPQQSESSSESSAE
jgi:hypothetical protein